MGPAQDGHHVGHRSSPEAEPLSLHRFLRHVPVVYVDYPGPASLTQIYGTFNRAMLRLIPSLRTYAEPLTAAMVEFYTMSQVLGLPAPGHGRALLEGRALFRVLVWPRAFLQRLSPGVPHAGHHCRGFCAACLHFPWEAGL